MKIIDENSITRETACSKSNLDIFFCNFTAELKVKKTCISDHYSVFLGFQTGTQMENKLEHITSRNWQKLKNISLIEKINFVLSHEISKLENCEKYKTIDNKFEELQILLKSILDRYLPKQVVKNKNHHSWVDNQLKRETAKKNRIFRESMKSKTTEAKEMYQEQRKKVKHMVKVKMKQFYHKIIEKHAAKSNRKFFQLIRNLSGNEREKVQNLNQKEVNDFNHFFATIGEKLNQKFRQSECSLKNQQVQSMFLLPTSKKEVLRVIQDSKSKYSEDYMDLNYIFVKSVAVSIARYLSKMINTCFQEGIFPDSLKIASVIPLHKEGEKNEPNNFRPISLTNSW